MERLRRWVFKGDRDFCLLFNQAAANLREGVELLEDLIRNYERIPEKVKAIEEVEHRGDEITHQIARNLNEIYVTRFDHEDISELKEKLDDVLDLVESAAARLYYFDIPQPTKSAGELVERLKKCVVTLEEMISRLDRPATISHKSLEDIHQWENEADDIQRAATAQAFKEAEKLIATGTWQEYCRAKLLADRWHEIYRRLEEAIDGCEDASDVIERMITKYG